MSPPKVILLSCLASGVVAAFVAAALVSALAPPADAPKRAETRPELEPRDRSELTRLETRIAELEGRLSQVEQKRRAREALEQYAKRLDQAEPSASDEPRGAAAGVGDAEDPRFELAVRSVLDRVDWEREEEERLTRAEQRSQRAQRQTALLRQRLTLTDEQASAVALALARQMERFRDLREGNLPEGEAQPASREEWRDRSTEIREETERRLGEILDETQMSGYRAFAEEEGLGPRGWGRPGRELRSRPEAPP